MFKLFVYNGAFWPKNGMQFMSLQLTATTWRATPLLLATVAIDEAVKVPY